MAKILVIIDMQNDFVKGHMSTPEARKAIAPILSRIDDITRQGGRVFFTLDTHLDQDYRESAPTAEANKLPPHCIKDTEGWRIIDELQPYVTASNQLEKPTFLGLELANLIGDKLEGTPEDVIELCGVCTDICVLSNALYLRACYPKAQIVVRGDCCAGLNAESHRAALTVLQSCLIQVE